MKKKRFIAILIALTTIIIAPNSVKALSTDYNYEVKYSETNLQLQQTYATEIQLIKDYVVNQGGIGSYQLSTGDYLFMIRTDQIANNNINVQLVNVNPSGSARSYYNSNQYGTSGAVGISITAYEQRYSINNGVVTPLNSANQVGSNYTWYIDTSTCNPNNADCILYDNTHYFDTFDITDTFTFPLVDNTAGVPNGKNTPLLLSNYDNVVYVVGENVSYKEFFDNMAPIPEIEPEQNSCPVVEVATILAPNNFTTGGSAIINKDNEIVWQEINFDTKLPITSLGAIPNDYWEILSYKGGENKDLYEYRYNFQCNVIQDAENVSDISYHCNLKYYFITDSEEDIKATAVFVVKRNTNYNSNILHSTIISAKKCSNNETNTMTNWNNDVTNDTNNDNWWNNITNTLSNIFNFLNPSNLIYIIVPTETQMQKMLSDTNESINNKMGILGLPITIYVRIMEIATANTQDNWCISWNGVKVPNFEPNEIIPSGEWCYNTILENQTINNFRNTCLLIIGGIILFSFLQYLNNTYHRILDITDRDDYQYIIVEDQAENNIEAIDRFYRKRDGGK